MNRISLTLFFCLLIIGVTAADRLPNQTPENQVFSVDTQIDATGQIESTEKMDWIIADPAPIPTDQLRYGQAIAITNYHDTLMSNGGKLSLNKNFDFDSKFQDNGLYNIESSKVLTYGSTEGSHLIGGEEYQIDNAGEYLEDMDDIRCVFASNLKDYPPFCDIVRAKSDLINMNSAQISTRGETRSVGVDEDIPAELNYQIAVTPDINSSSGYADGAVKTVYSGGIMEGRDSGWWPSGTIEYISPWGDVYTYEEYSSQPSATNTWKDSSEASGGIKTFQKALDYKSGFKI